MAKKIITVLLLICITSSVFALDMKNAEPYNKEEFPKWTVNLRREETIFFGSLPITFTATSLLMNKALKKDWSFWKNAAVACSASAVITIADFIIDQIKNK